MSSLTPTLTKTPQIPLIPTRSFAKLPDFATKVQEALDLVDPADMEVVVQKKQEIEQQKAHFTTLIEELKESQKDYDFSDYEERLLFSDSEIENILETQIFRKYEIMTELGKVFYGYLEVLTEGKSEELKMKMKKKLVKEFGLEDRVYKGGESVMGVKQEAKRITFESKEKSFQDIQAIGLLGIKNLVFRCYNEPPYDPSVSEFKMLVQVAGIAGIRNLNLSFNRLFKIFKSQEMLLLVKQAGESGIKSLNLSSNGLFLRLESQDLFSLVKQAGESGIKSLDLSYNNLFIFESQNVLLFVQQIRESGIRSLNLWGHNLLSRLDAQEKLEINNITKHCIIKLS
ncbi:MAG: hypothetical protein PHH70_02735 [Candidatus Gracilibacteria bacterium]|nr:hypothetical protein [Candidatus Gracilibacteria bacterium]